MVCPGLTVETACRSGQFQDARPVVISDSSVSLL